MSVTEPVTPPLVVEEAFDPGSPCFMACPYDAYAAIWAAARELTANLARSRGGDLVADFARVLPLLVTYQLVGIPPADQAGVKEGNDAWLALQVIPLSPEQQLSCAQTLIGYEAYLRKLLVRRIDQPADDISTGLAQASVGADPVCTLDQAVVATRFMIASGHERRPPGSSAMPSTGYWKAVDCGRRWCAIPRWPRRPSRRHSASTAQPRARCG